MKIEKAIERMKSYKTVHTDDYFDVAIESLNKQVPHPPELKVHPDYPRLGENYYCTECGEMFTRLEAKQTNYCTECGQKLRETEEE